jgi:hypothetical protein
MLGITIQVKGIDFEQIILLLTRNNNTINLNYIY